VGDVLVTNRVYSAVLIILVVAVVIMGGILLGGIIFPENRVVTPHIIPTNGDQPPIFSTFSYPFEKNPVTLSVSVNRSVYEGARTSDKSVTIIGNVSENVWVADSYRAMADDPALEGLYQDIIVQFRKIRDAQNLDDDEYLELISVYVQSLKYETLEENPVKFPIETVVDQAGDCDDKSLLLAGILSREGYSVALLSFGPEKHMAIGIGSKDYRYKNTNYTFLETTNVSFVGVPTEKLGRGISLQSSPIIIPVGSGSRIYTSGTETAYIQESLLSSKRMAEELEPEVKTMQSEIDAKQVELRDMETRMQILRTAGKVKEYNAMVSSHNERVSGYNSQLSTYREIFTRYEKYATIHNYILDHEFDRKGVYEYIRTNMLV
jgi:hypothetical protein